MENVHALAERINSQSNQLGKGRVTSRVSPRNCRKASLSTRRVASPLVSVRLDFDAIKKKKRRKREKKKTRKKEREKSSRRRVAEASSWVKVKGLDRLRGPSRLLIMPPRGCAERAPSSRLHFTANRASMRGNFLFPSATFSETRCANRLSLFLSFSLSFSFFSFISVSP